MTSNAVCRTNLEAEIVVRVVTVVNNGRVKPMSILHDDVMSFSGDHWRHSLCCWIKVVEEILHHVCFTNTNCYYQYLDRKEVIFSPVLVCRSVCPPDYSKKLTESKASVRFLWQSGFRNF